MTETVERHTLLFSDVEVTTLIAGDGEVSVEFVSPNGRNTFSFDSTNWAEVVLFVENSVKVTSC